MKQLQMNENVQLIQETTPTTAILQYSAGNMDILIINAHGFPSNRLNQEKEGEMRKLLENVHVAIIMETGVNSDHNL